MMNDQQNTPFRRAMSMYGGMGLTPRPQGQFLDRDYAMQLRRQREAERAQREAERMWQAGMNLQSKQFYDQSSFDFLRDLLGPLIGFGGQVTSAGLTGGLSNRKSPTTGGAATGKTEP